MAGVYWALVLPLAIAIGLAFKVNLSSCSGWALLVLFHGLVVKPIFVFFELPSRELLELTLLQRISFEEYWSGSVLLLLPYALFVIGMFAVGRYGRRKAPVSSNGWRTLAFSEPALCMMGFVALAGVVVFFLQFPQLLESANKNTIATDDLTEYSSGGIWRAMAEMSYLASLCALVNLGLGRRRSSNRALFVLLAVLWLSFCLLSDQRGALVFSLVTYVVAYGRWVRPVPRRLIAALGVVLVIVVVGKTAMRLRGEGAESGADLAAVAANFIGQNFIENGKTVSIFKAVPQALDYQLGKTYLDGVLILVPRALYPAKTTVNLDTLVGNAVFECGAFGACAVPAGLIGEAYLNFGLAGVLPIALLSGALVGWIDRRFRSPRIGSASELLFVYSLLFIGMSILGSGYSGVITQFVVQGLSLAAVLAIAGRRVPGRSDDYIDNIGAATARSLHLTK